MQDNVDQVVEAIQDSDLVDEHFKPMLLAVYHSLVQSSEHLRRSLAVDE